MAGGVLLASALGGLLLWGGPSANDATASEIVYEARCAYCHDLDGAIGVKLDERVIRSYGSARRLFNYLRIAMPYDAPRTMIDSDIWLTTGYLLRSRGIVPPGTRVGDSTADEVTFQPWSPGASPRAPRSGRTLAGGRLKRIECRCGGPPWLVDVPRAGPVGCTMGVVSVSREPLNRGRHGRACIRTQGAAMGEWATIGSPAEGPRDPA